MKALIFSSTILASLLLVAWQHQQIGHLRTENASLQQSAAEADQLRADLATSNGDEAQDEAEIARLKEENRDLLKLRNEVGQLQEARAEFERASAENKQLQQTRAGARSADAKQPATQPVTIRIVELYDRGLSTPDNAVQTFFWAQRDGNREAMSRCVTPRSWKSIRDGFDRGQRQNLNGILSIEIVARRMVNATMVQLGIELHGDHNLRGDKKEIITLVLEDGDWRVEMQDL
jgi:hypothetical protein